MKNKFEYYKNVVTKKYATFDGRATRSEYWYFVLFNTLISIGISIVASIIGGKFLNDVVSGLYSLAMIIPMLAVTIRRLHDIGRSGWWLLVFCISPAAATTALFAGYGAFGSVLVFVSAILGIVGIIFFVTDSTPGDNKYGPNPKGVTGGAPTSTPAAPTPTSTSTPTA